MTDSVRYNGTARLLHWTIAVLIIVNLILGIGHDPLGEILPAMPIHKSIGLTVLALSLFRLVWRLTHTPPPLPVSVAGWEKGAAHAMHWLLYALMILLPLSGWIMSSAGTRPLQWFWLFDVPKFDVAKGDAIVGLSGGGHGLMGYAMIALLIGHIGAALRHHFLLKDDVLRRMLP
ncbi:cytochrome b [Sphingomonas montanisoli]|uniref:Cytochrome b n=1 Tax=Sphingomonas montanisoli TaxID=2606412 RepID=A0A5D9C8I8_9SPHN|nr:cytochrome b [Sphingomonas montanisoli]TZG26341.1 cytochrome b [Sphingomonas montanisoli]